MPGLNITDLRLDLSSDIDQRSLEELLSAVGALPHLATLAISVNGRFGGTINANIRFALADSKACLSTASVRSWIANEFIEEAGGLQDLHQKFRSDSERLFAAAEKNLNQETANRRTAESSCGFTRQRDGTTRRACCVRCIPKGGLPRDGRAYQ
jgi:hypothetical protein